MKSGLSKTIWSTPERKSYQKNITICIITCSNVRFGGEDYKILYHTVATTTDVISPMIKWKAFTEAQITININGIHVDLSLYTILLSMKTAFKSLDREIFWLPKLSGWRCFVSLATTTQNE
jgi:hypothetical protein